MNLESLPNEILLDLFGCLNSINLLQAFYGLNFRFNLLLYKQFRAYRFIFPFNSKREFDMICQQHLPFIADRVIALTLVNGDQSPGLIHIFFSYMPSIAQFTHLRFLKFYWLHSYQILIKIVNGFSHLYNLTRLDFKCCDCQNDTVDFQFIVNNIWSLPKLTYCHFDIQIGKQESFCLPTKISTTLKDVHVSKYELKFNQIHNLFECTPSLKHLSIRITPDDNEDYKPSPLSTLTNLDIRAFSISDISKLISLLQSIPNVRRLNLFLISNSINGYQWEQVIRNYLPKLKVFKLRMEYDLSVNQNVQEQADELINSFRSPFWTDEHKWFVRCFRFDRTIHIQTLSSTFVHMEKKLPDSWKSTYPYDDHQKLDDITTHVFSDIFFDQLFPFHRSLNNLRYLCIKFPINNQFWSIVPNLKQLRSLTISSYDDTFQSQLQTLLDRAPHLQYLQISRNVSSPLQMSLFNCTNISVRQLNLQRSNYQLNEEECMALTRSPLGVQCEVLIILVKNRESILILVQNIINLRALHVKLTMNDDESSNENTINKEEVIQWLKDRLPSTCLISVDPNLVDGIQIWIK